MKQAKYSLALAAVFSLLAASALHSVGIAEGTRTGIRSDTQTTPVLLDVTPIQQSLPTSCGEAAIVMAAHFANPERAISEASVIGYAESSGLYKPRKAPFTSPADMVSIARHFSGDVSAGHVDSQGEGLVLLQQELDSGQPVIIDITTLLYDATSGAHFVVVTGFSTDPQSGETTITFNNPLSGEQQAADWAGTEGIWNAWQNNGDPGGAGWWMVIPAGESSRFW
jgi:hypothetical protein